MAYTPIFFSVDDITDNLASNFVRSTDDRLDRWYADADTKTYTLARTLGLQTTDVVFPVFDTIKDYAIYSLYLRLFSDVKESNESAYAEKIADYNVLREKLVSKITAEMFKLGANGTLTQSAFVGTVYLNRI